MSTEPLSAAELAALREAEAKMTPGPWLLIDGSLVHDYWGRIVERIGGWPKENASGLLLMRNAFPRLLKQVEALTADNESLRARLGVEGDMLKLIEQVKTLTGERDSLRREVEELRSALEPFARIGRNHPCDDPQDIDRHVSLECTGSPDVYFLYRDERLTHRHFAEAARHSAPEREGDNGEGGK